MSELSVVILCYRSGEKINEFVRKNIRLLNRFVPDGEIVLVGNYKVGSGDITPDVVRRIADGNDKIKAVTLPKEGMMGWDARSGLREATGRYICLIDGDEQMPYRDIVRVYRKIVEENLDLVTTYRAVRHDGTYRRITSFFYNLIFKILFPGIKSRDINSKPKIMSREVYQKMKLTSDDWFLDAEIMIQARRLRLKVGEVPAKFYRCNYRNSFVETNTIFEFIANLIKARIKEFTR